jgi:excinuclease UvrABC ATPase subunit
MDCGLILGPEGGKGGGLIAEGTPEQVMEAKNPYRYIFLKSMLEQGMKRSGS